MDLQEVLRRNKSKADKSNVAIKYPTIATDERPYYFPFEENANNKPSSNSSSHESTTNNQNVLTNKQERNRKETGKKQEIIKETTGNKPEINRQAKTIQNHETGNKLASKPESILAINREKSGNKAEINEQFSSLVGLERALVLFIYNECLYLRSNCTGKITLEYLSSSLGTTPASAKVTKQHVEKKGFISTISYKNGRGGWCKYSIPDAIHQQIIKDEIGKKLEINRKETGNKPESKPESKPEIPFASSSSFINNIKTTTTDESEFLKIESRWLEIDIEPLAKIKFTETHLKQIALQNLLTPEVVQDSIYAYAFDLEYNDKAKTLKGDPLNYFMGIVRKGKPYAPSANYESPKDRAMRIYLERQREIKQRRAAMEKEALELAFKEWFFKLKKDEISKLMPKGFTYKNGSKICEETARAYFAKEIWINKRTEITLDN